MTNKDKEEQILGNLAEKPICWYLERPGKIRQLLDWQFELPMLVLKRELFLKYLRVLRAAGLERCEYCGQWVDAKTLVRVPMMTWNPASTPMTCCEGTCEIELLSSR